MLLRSYLNYSKADMKKWGPPYYFRSKEKKRKIEEDETRPEDARPAPLGCYFDKNPKKLKISTPDDEIPVAFWFLYEKGVLKEAKEEEIEEETTLEKIENKESKPENITGYESKKLQWIYQEWASERKKVFFSSDMQECYGYRVTETITMNSRPKIGFDKQASCTSICRKIKNRKEFLNSYACPNLSFLKLQIPGSFDDRCDGECVEKMDKLHLSCLMYEVIKMDNLLRLRKRIGNKLVLLIRLIEVALCYLCPCLCKDEKYLSFLKKLHKYFSDLRIKESKIFREFCREIEIIVG